jgi:S-formylglutathione hydrolase FrmB
MGVRAVVILVSLLALWASVVRADDLRRVEIRSEAVGRTLHYGVLLPPDYEQTERRCPTIYLLHGLGGNYAGWLRYGVDAVPWRERTILVLVDVGNTWYFNWPDAVKNDARGRQRVVQRNRWEDYVVGELVADVDRRFRADPQRRGLCGYSMGGYGAALLALRHPERFHSVAVLGGAPEFARQLKLRLAAGQNIQIEQRGRLSKEPEPEIDTPGFSSQDERTPLSLLPEDPSFYDAHDPFMLVPALSATRDPTTQPGSSEAGAAQSIAPPTGAGCCDMPDFLIICGMDDAMLDQNRRFVKLLQECKVPFCYAERPGGHDAAFLRAALHEALTATVRGLEERRVGSAHQFTDREPSAGDTRRRGDRR